MDASRSTTERADTAERHIADLLSQVRILTQEKLQLTTQLSKSQQELQLWKIQLDLAQKEILRAQQVVDQVDRARVDAEERSHRYHQKLRRLLEERAIQIAMDEGRRLGYQEGLELGRRRQHSQPTPSKPRPTPRPPTRRSSAPQDLAPIPPVAVPPINPQPPPPTSLPIPDPSRSPEEIRPHINAPNLIPPPRPVSVHNSAETVHDTYDVPPDNYIPTIHQGDAGITLPPPHEWTSQPGRPRSDSQTARPRSESRASAKPARPRSDSRTTAPLSPPPISVRNYSHRPIQPPQRPSPPRSTTSQQSSHISQYDLVGPPSEPSRSQMTQPERIADEWRSQNPDMLTPSQGDSSPLDPIPRPMSSGLFRPIRPDPLQRPITADPTRSRTPKPTNAPRKTRQVTLPIPASNLFYDANANPSGEWLRSRFQKERSVSNATIPNIDVEPPSQSPTNTEGTVVDPVLLTPEHTNRSTSLPDPDTSTSVAPTSTTYWDNHHPYYQQPSVRDSTSDFITGVVPSEKMFPPGFIPLSPIPTLSNLTAIPENCSQPDININPRSTTSASPTATTGKPPTPGPIYSSVPVPGPLTGIPYPGFYPAPADIMVMRSELTPSVRQRQDTHTSHSPAPLNRPLSIFSDV